MNKKVIGLAVLGAGAYFLFANKGSEQAQTFIDELPSGNRGVMDGIGTGGGGAVISTASPTGTATGGDTYNTTYNFESPNIDFAPASLDQKATTDSTQGTTTAKKQPTRPSGAYSSEILQQSFKTEAEGKKAEADARAKKQPSGSSYFNLPQNDAYKYFNIPQQAKPTTTAKKQPTSPNPTAPFTPAQAVSLVPTAIINPIGAVAQGTGYLMSNFATSFFRGR